MRATLFIVTQSTYDIAQCKQTAIDTDTFFCSISDCTGPFQSFTACKINKVEFRHQCFNNALVGKFTCLNANEVKLFETSGLNNEKLSLH
jgi:hypothetical protein